jgi:hypothetical protein
VALERAIVLDTGGGRRSVSRDDRDELVRLAADWGQAMVFEEIAKRQSERDRDDPGHLGDVVVDVPAASDGMVLTYTPARFDMMRYLAVSRARTTDEDPSDVGTLRALVRYLNGDDEPPADLLELSEAYKADTGHHLFDIFSALYAGYQMASHEVTGARRAEFDRQVRNLPGNWSFDVRAALPGLTFTHGVCRLEDLVPHNLRWQPARLIERPFVVDGDVVYLIRDLLFESLCRHWMYVVSGEWPIPYWNRQETLPTFHRALQSRRSRRGLDAYEPLLQRRLDEIGVPFAQVASGVRLGAARSTREIDAVVVLPESRVIWVLEAKDEFKDGTMLGVRAEIDGYFKTKGHVELLARSVAEVEADPRAVALHVMHQARQRWAGHEDPRLSGRVAELRAQIRSMDGHWTVKGAVVARDTSPVEFIAEMPFPVANADSVGALLTSAKGAVAS